MPHYSWNLLLVTFALSFPICAANIAMSSSDKLNSSNSGASRLIRPSLLVGGAFGRGLA